MLELAKVNRVVKKAASAVLKGPIVRRVISKPTVDSYGDEALDITIVLKRGSFGKIKGDDALDTLVSIANALRDAKEQRFPILTYVTEEELEELEANDDTES